MRKGYKVKLRMKKLLFLLSSFLFLFGSCSSNGTKKNQKNDLELAYERAEKAIEREDTIYLGFWFGMSKKDVENHFVILV